MSNPITRVEDVFGRPATRWATLTQSDTVDITQINGMFPRSIYSESAITITMLDHNGDSGAFVFAAGEIKPLSPSRIMDTGTGAGIIIGLF